MGYLSFLGADTKLQRYKLAEIQRYVGRTDISQRLPATILHHLFISLFSIEKQTDDAFSDGKGMQSSHLRS